MVVSSVFAFTVLSTGLFSKDKAKETHAAGLSEARGTLELKGSVVAKASGTMGMSGAVTSIAFPISEITASEAIVMTAGITVITNSDETQSLSMNTSTESSARNIVASGYSDSLVGGGEVFQITLLDITTQLDTDLGANTAFTLEMIHPKGAVLFIRQRTLESLASSNRLLTPSPSPQYWSIQDAVRIESSEILMSVGFFAMLPNLCVGYSF